MHMRTKKWARPELAACPYFAEKPHLLRGQWASCFAAAQPLHLELGCGKGVSTAQMAHATPDVNYIAIDISPDVLGVARRNLEATYGETPVSNIMLTRCDIEHIDSFIAPEDRIERIYIHFCNPWSMRPKHHKRRLTHPRQLMLYREFLVDEGEIWFKTDDADLFRDSLKYFAACGFVPRYQTDDLHASGFTPNFVSEHEAKYSAEGIPIHFGIFVKQPGPVTIDPLRWRIWHAMDRADAVSKQADDEQV